MISLSLDGLLRCFGLIPLMDQADSETNIVIDEESGVIKSVTTIHDNIWRKILNYTYKFLIICIISWYPAACIIISGKERNDDHVRSNIFSIMAPIQYMWGVIYYGGRTFIEHKADKIIDKRSSIAISVSIVSILMTITVITLIAKDTKMSVYGILYDGTHDVSRVFYMILVSCDRLLSYGIVFINTTIFMIMLSHHKNEIKEFSNNLILLTESDQFVDISTIIADFARVKEGHSRTVRAMNALFSSITIIGLLALFFISLKNTDDIGPLQYMHTVIFVTLEVLYFYIISVLKSTIDDIKKYVIDKKFIDKYMTIGHNNIYIQDGTVDDSIVDDIDVITNITRLTLSEIQNQTQFVNWRLMRNTLSGEWEKFNIMGIDIDDTKVVQQAIVFFFAIVFAIDLKDILDL